MAKFTDNEIVELVIDGKSRQLKGNPSLIEHETNQNGEYVAEDFGVDGFSKFTVDVSNPEVVEKTITENGTYNASDDNVYGYSSVKVNVVGEDMLQARVDETKSCAYLFYNYEGTNPNIAKNLNTTGVKSMTRMFYGCSALTSVNLSNLDTNNVTLMNNMFENCYDLTSLDLSNFNTSNVTNMSRMFSGCRELTSLDLSNLDTSNVTDMSSMFYDCRSLEELNVSSFNTFKVTSMGSTFRDMQVLTSLDLSNFDTSNVKNMLNMFTSSKALKSIKGVIDMINITTTSASSSMFQNCSALETVILKNIKTPSLTIGLGTIGLASSYGHLLTLDTLINTVKELWDYSSGTTTYNLTMSTPSKELLANVYVKLVEPTAEQIEADPNIVNKMPCEVCESTDEGAMLIIDYATLKKWTIK